MSESLAFYRKYRPQTVEDLDSEAVRAELTTVLKSGRVPHAFLFCGPRGTGKTSSARILAKAVNCTDKKGFEPCNKCEACLSITNGSNVDVIEIDGASNRGIDEIRDLREKIRLSPSSLKKKVYIIDEVHMLTSEAFNALLKTLEEPPTHAFFVLCTTEAHKIPETISSRCRNINFKRATKAEVLRSLRRVVGGEKIEIEKEAMDEIAKQADGSFRDGVKLLEQVSLLNKKITKNDLIKELYLESFFDNLFKRDAKTAIDFINKTFENGVDLKVLNIKILDYLRNLLLIKNGVAVEEEIKNYDFASDDLLKLVDLFSKAAVDYKTAVIPQLPLELAVVGWCKNKDEKKIIFEEIEEKKEELPPKKDDKKTEEKIEMVSVSSSPSKITLENFRERWLEILKSVKPHNHSVEAFLKACSPMVWDGRYLTLEVFYKFHKERLEDEKCRSLVEKIVSDVMQEVVKLKFVLGGGKRVVKSEENISGAVPPTDIVKAAEEIFGGNVE